MAKNVLKRKKRSKSKKQAIKFESGGGLSADAIYNACMAVLPMEPVCQALKSIFCTILPSAPGCGGGSPTCKPIGQACASNTECCDNFCQQGACSPPL